MRPFVPFVLLMLCSCQREPSFDERYAKVAHDLRASSAAIDAELASEAALAPSEAPPPVPASSRAAR